MIRFAIGISWTLFFGFVSVVNWRENHSWTHLIVGMIFSVPGLLLIYYGLRSEKKRQSQHKTMNVPKEREQYSKTQTMSVTIVRAAGIILLPVAIYIFFWSPIGPRRARLRIVEITQGIDKSERCDVCGTTENLTPVRYERRRTLYFCNKHIKSAPTSITTGHDPSLLFAVIPTFIALIFGACGQLAMAGSLATFNKETYLHFTKELYVSKGITKGIKGPEWENIGPANSIIIVMAHVVLYSVCLGIPWIGVSYYLWASH